MPAAALVRFEQYAEISAMLRAGEDQALLALVAQPLSLVARALGGIVGRCGLDTFTVCVPDVDEQGAARSPPSCSRTWARPTNWAAVR